MGPTIPPRSMKGPKRRAGIFAAFIAASFALGGVGWAQQQECVGLEITPARLEQDLRWSHSYDTVVRNCTDEALRITTAVAGLGHDLDGAPEFLDSSSAEQALRLKGGGAFTLAPGATRRLRATAAIQKPGRSLYAGIVAEFEPLNLPAGTSVDARSRVAGMLLMRGPKPWRETARVVDVGLTPNADGTYTIYAAVEDTGNVHIVPRGTVQVIKDGKVLDTVKLAGGTILPGYKRRLVGLWTPPDGLDGRVTLNADVTDPPATGSAEIDFSRGEAAVPAARITSLVASDAGGAYIEVTLRNIGRIPITPTIEVIVHEDDFERARMLFPQTEPVEPDAIRTVAWEPELADGTYRVTARAVQGEELLDEKVTGLRIGEAPVVPEAGGGMPLWVVALAIVLLIVVLAALMLVLVRKRRSDDEPPPSAQPVRELSRTGAR